MVYLAITMCLVTSCTTQAESETSDAATSDAATSAPTPAVEPAPVPPAAPLDQEPQAYVPSTSPGDAVSYGEVVDKLNTIVPSELRDQVPWPDLRNPNPIVAQTEIFELWIWMVESLTEPQLVEIMAAPGSPSRETVVSVFGSLNTQNVFEVRPGQPYQAFDHRVVTFESAGLPLWLARGVPEDAVVVYYSDNSGPVDVIDQDTRAIVRQQAGVPTRVWLSIMVPTDVGWQLWRDQLIEPGDPDLQVPDVLPPPSANPVPRTPEL